jgi:effector-binding domain-containing protein
MAKPKLEKRKAQTIAYIEHSGPYDKVPWDKYIESLYGFAKAKKVMPGFYPLAIYFDNPQETPENKLRSHIAIPIHGNPKPDKDIKIGKLPAMTVASVSHKGPGEEFKNTYQQLNDFIKEKNLKCAGPPMEIYTKKPEVVGGKTILFAKVMIPTKKG